nr:Down syndrome cell adhesion molecule homolog [Parasteatoda tepidariorum]
MEFKWLHNGKELVKGSNVEIRSLQDLSTLVINPLTEADSGNYSCIVNSRGLSSSYHTFLEVLIPPTWKEVPRDIDSLSGDTVHLNCKGSGIPQPTTSWSKSSGENNDFNHMLESKDIVTFQNGTLVIHSITREDGGLYRCNVSNGIGTPLIKTVAIKVIVPPTWKEVPRDIDSLSGDTVHLNCKGSGIPQPTTSWSKSSGENNDFIHMLESKDIDTFQNGTLVIHSITREDGGLYRCNVSNGIGTPLIKTVAIKVIDALKIQPFSFPPQSAIGQRVSVTCTPLQGEKIEFKWLHNGLEIMNGRQNVNIASLPLFSNLIINSLTPEDSGNYTCVVHSKGFKGSYTTTLDVLSTSLKHLWHHLILFFSDALKIQPFSFPPRSAIGQRVSVTCTPLQGEKIEFKWLHNGLDIMSRRQNVNIASLPLVSNLIINSLTPEDSGNYTCVVHSKGFKGSYTTTLDVLIPPSWISVPTDTDAISGSSLNLHCNGSGKPVPAITWSKSKSDSSDFTSLLGISETKVRPNGNLHIENIQKEDEGMYKCNVSNGIGNSLIKTIMVKVIGNIF